MDNPDDPLSDIGDRPALLPAIVLAILVVWGLVVRPLVLDRPAIPLEIVFLASAGFAIAQLLWLGFSWLTIQRSIVQRLAKALPASRAAKRLSLRI